MTEKKTGMWKRRGNGRKGKGKVCVKEVDKKREEKFEKRIRMHYKRGGGRNKDVNK